MFVGHSGVAFAVKTPRNKFPLWVLFVAVQLLDFLWAPFVLLERMLPKVGEEIKMWIKHDPDFDALHGGPRFQRLIKSITQTVLNSQ